MNASDLRVFEAVARLGGMNRAAVELHTVQSNVTARIRGLEEELGAVLFVRHTRGTTPTPAGQRLLPYAYRVAHMLEDARRAVADDGSPQGTLRIGTLETTAARRLPSVLAGYAAAYPEVDLTISTGTTCELIERVLARQLEGAFVCGPVQHPELEEQPVFQEELVVVTAPTVRSLAALSAVRGLKIVVLRVGCSYRQRLETLLAKWGVVGLRQLEFGTLDAIIGCVAAGIGITLLPRAVVEAAAQEGRVALYSLPPQEAKVATVFVRCRDAHASSALRAFLAHARSGLADPEVAKEAPARG